jgi:hypothetical protein
MSKHSVLNISLLLGSLLSLTGCFNRLDTTAVEREIEAEIESQSRRLFLSEVRCPRDVHRQAGAYFRCVGQLRPEGQFTINVTQTDSQGSIEWDVPNSEVILNMVKVEDKLQESFAKEFSQRAVIDCGEAYRMNQAGEQFECQLIGDVALGQGRVTSLLVRVDPEGNLTWHEVLQANLTMVRETAAGGATEADSADSAPPSGQASPVPGGATAGDGTAGSRNIQPPRYDP